MTQSQMWPGAVKLLSVTFGSVPLSTRACLKTIRYPKSQRSLFSLALLLEGTDCRSLFLRGSMRLQLSDSVNPSALGAKQQINAPPARGGKHRLTGS